jgi:hypothetical protein
MPEGGGDVKVSIWFAHNIEYKVSENISPTKEE